MLNIFGPTAHESLLFFCDPLTCYVWCWLVVWSAWYWTADHLGCLVSQCSGPVRLIIECPTLKTSTLPTDLQWTGCQWGVAMMKTIQLKCTGAFQFVSGWGSIIIHDLLLLHCNNMLIANFTDEGTGNIAKAWKSTSSKQQNCAEKLIWYLFQY